MAADAMSRPGPRADRRDFQEDFSWTGGWVAVAMPHPDTAQPCSCATGGSRANLLPILYVADWVTGVSSPISSSSLPLVSSITLNTNRKDRAAKAAYRP